MEVMETVYYYHPQSTEKESRRNNELVYGNNGSMVEAERT